MKLIRLLTLLFLGLLLFSSCEKESDRYIVVNPMDLAFNLNSGDVLKLNISAYSIEGIKKLEIRFIPKNDLSAVLLDTVIEQSNTFNLYWEYQIPSFPDPLLEAELSIKATDVSEEEVWHSSLLYITSSDYLTELAGFEIHSSLAESSSNHNSFSFFTKNTLQSNFADSSDLHIMDATDTSYTDESLSLKWLSPAGSRFVRFNDFDYASAKLGDLTYSYSAGISSPFINDIKAKDIILMKYTSMDARSSGYAAIKITSVIDEPGVENDRYIFNIKY